MKDPNNNPVVQEVARELVGTVIRLKSADADLAAMKEGRAEAVAYTRDVYEEAQAIIDAAQRQAREMIEEARAIESTWHEGHAEALNEAVTIQREVDHLQATLEAARVGSWEDIEIALGEYVVRVSLNDDGEPFASCRIPVKLS